MDRQSHNYERLLSSLRAANEQREDDWEKIMSQKDRCEARQLQERMVDYETRITAIDAEKDKWMAKIEQITTRFASCHSAHGQIMSSQTQLEASLKKITKKNADYEQRVEALMQPDTSIARQREDEKKMFLEAEIVKHQAVSRHENREMLKSRLGLLQVNFDLKNMQKLCSDPIRLRELAAIMTAKEDDNSNA